MRRPIKDIWLGTSMSSLLHGGVFLLLLLGIPVLPMLLDSKDTPPADSAQADSSAPRPPSPLTATGRDGTVGSGGTAPAALPAAEITLDPNTTKPLSTPRPSEGSSEPAPAPSAISVELVAENSLPTSVKKALARQEKVGAGTDEPPKATTGPAPGSSRDTPPPPPQTAASELPPEAPRRAPVDTGVGKPAQAEASSSKAEAAAAEPATSPSQQTATDTPAADEPAAARAPGGGGNGGTGGSGTDPAGKENGPGLNAADNLRIVTLPPERTVDGVEELVRLIDEAVPILRRNAGIDPSTPPSTETRRRQRLVFDRMQRAAQHGNANAQFTLAKMLLNGEGRERNVEEAKTWLNRSAENGYVRAQLLLGYLAARGGTGSGGVPDLATADMWFWAASRKNYQIANDIRARLVPLMRSDEVLRARRMKSSFTSLLALLPSGMSGSADELDAANDSLRNAAAAGNVNDLLKALSQGADVDGKDDDGRTAMINAAWRGRSDVVQILLDHGADIGISDDRGRTPMIWGAINGQTKVVQALLDAGAEPNHTDEEGVTALMRAAWNGHRAIVNILLQSGSDPARRDKNGRTALDHAVREGHGEIAARLKNAAPLR